LPEPTTYDPFDYQQQQQPEQQEPRQEPDLETSATATPQLRQPKSAPAAQHVQRNMLMNIILRPGGGDKAKALPKPTVDVRSEGPNVIVVRMTFPQSDNIHELHAFTPKDPEALGKFDEIDDVVETRSGVNVRRISVLTTENDVAQNSNNEDFKGTRVEKDAFVVEPVAETSPITTTTTATTSTTTTTTTTSTTTRLIWTSTTTTAPAFFPHQDDSWRWQDVSASPSEPVVSTAQALHYLPQPDLGPPPPPRPPPVHALPPRRPRLVVPQQPRPHRHRPHHRHAPSRRGRKAHHAAHRPRPFRLLH
jgi:hypothetical protein